MSPLTLGVFVVGAGAVLIHLLHLPDFALIVVFLLALVVTFLGLAVGRESEAQQEQSEEQEYRKYAEQRDNQAAYRERYERERRG